MLFLVRMSFQPNSVFFFSFSYSLGLKAKKKHSTSNEHASLRVSFNQLYHRMQLLDNVQMAYIPSKSGLINSTANSLCALSTAHLVLY
jgi:hypothetical protein